MRKNRRAALALVFALAASTAISVAPAAATGSDANNYTYQVTVENLTENQILTPVVAAAHSASFRLFRPGHEASDGLQQLAENGGVPILAAELAGNDKVEAVEVIGSAPIAPGGYATVLISTDAAHRSLSVAGMLICTNDGFAGRTSISLPSRVGNERVFYAGSYDTGTEMNTEAYVDLVPPCDGLGQSGTSNPALAENGVVREHGGIIGGIGDLTVANNGWDDPAMKITVERVRTFEVTVENLTGGQPLTPAVFATHARWQSIFESGHAASNGIQQLAENGGVPVLASELTAANGVGTVAVVGGAPILPGASATLDIVVSDHYGWASLAGMLICSNDGFGGVDTLRLPRWVGEETEVYGAAYDAGTELNTEAYADLVPPCDGQGQTGMSNPALAENGVVHMHDGIIGGADLSPEIHGWDGAVIKVTVERTG
jgi:hypothetical protein